MNKTVQAKDVPDLAMECAIVTSMLARDGHWATRWDVEELLPEYPPKILLAKAKAFIRRGLIDGCTCGCRGDYELETPRPLVTKGP